MGKREKIAVLIDVDGTLASPYIQGTRTIRHTSIEALRLLAKCTEVYLWSHAGAENGERLLAEFPELQNYISGSFSKQNFPKGSFDKVYCIDDEKIDQEVLSERHIILNDTYDGGKDSGVLLEAVRLIVADISGDSNTPSQSDA